MSLLQVRKIVIIALLAALGQSAYGVTLPRHINAALEKALTQELKKQNLLSGKGKRVAYEISRIDSRLRLASCSKPLQVDFQGRRLTGRVSARVECLRPSPWAVHIPVDIRVYKKIVSTTAPLPRGHTLTMADLQVIEKDVSLLRNGYFTSYEELNGKELRRPLSLNGVITPRMVVNPMAIKRGDEVMILAQKGMLTVRSPGIALIDGRVGQQIRVRNTASKRVIKAEIIKKGLVKILI